MLTKKQEQSISFFLARSMGLGIGISNLFNLAGKDTWIAMILGTFIGIFILAIISYVFNNNKDFLDILKKKTIFNYLIKFIYLFFIMTIIIINFSSFTSLVTSFLLPYTPAFLVTIPFVILLIMISEKGLKVIGRIAEILFPICLIINIIKTLLLARYSNFDFFFPIMTTNIKDILMASIIFGILSSIPFIFLMDEKIKLKENIKNYLISSIISLIVVCNITSVLGEELAKIFSFPEYVVLRKIKFFNFLENIENLIAGIWLIDLFMTEAMVVVKTKELFTKKPYIAYIILIVLSLIVDFIIIDDFSHTMFIYKEFMYILTIISSIFLIILLIKKQTLKNTEN